MIAWYSVDRENHIDKPEVLNNLAAALQDYEAGVVSAVSTDQDDRLISAHGVAEIEDMLVGIEIRRRANGKWTVVFSTPIHVATEPEVVG